MGAWNDLIPDDPQLRTAHLIYLCLGAFITLFGLVSLVIKDRLFMSEAMVAILVGVIVGPIVGKVLDPQAVFGASLLQVSLEFCRIVVGIQCMACGVDLPGNYIFREWISLAVLLGPVMIYMWGVGALGLYVIFGFDVWTCLIISACMTPTDPVLANSIVKGKFAEKHIPLNVRLILSAESGANDGLGTPFLFLAVYLMRMPESPGLAIGEWLTKVVLYQIVLSVLIGCVVAYLAQLALKTAVKRDLIDKESILSFSIALAIFIEGLVSLLGSDDILASFVAGNVLTWDLWFNERVASTHFQEVIDALLNLSFFVFIGAVTPWSSFNSSELGLEIWKLILYALWMLLLRRIPIVMLMQSWIPSLKNSREAFFAGWFGPIGAGAIFYAHVAVVYLDFPATHILPIVYFIVASSVFVHGGSVGFFHLSLQRAQTGVYARWAHMRQRQRETELSASVAPDAGVFHASRGGDGVLDALAEAPGTMWEALGRLKEMQELKDGAEGQERQPEAEILTQNASGRHTNRDGDGVLVVPVETPGIAQGSSERLKVVVEIEDEAKRWERQREVETNASLKRDAGGLRAIQDEDDVLGALAEAPGIPRKASGKLKVEFRTEERECQREPETDASVIADAGEMRDVHVPGTEVESSGRGQEVQKLEIGTDGPLSHILEDKMVDNLEGEGNVVDEVEEVHKVEI